MKQEEKQIDGHDYFGRDVDHRSHGGGSPDSGQFEIEKKKKQGGQEQDREDGPRLDDGQDHPQEKPWDILIGGCRFCALVRRGLRDSANDGAEVSEDRVEDFHGHHRDLRKRQPVLPTTQIENKTSMTASAGAPKWMRVASGLMKPIQSRRLAKISRPTAIKMMTMKASPAQEECFIKLFAGSLGSSCLGGRNLYGPELFLARVLTDSFIASAMDGARGQKVRPR